MVRGWRACVVFAAFVLAAITLCGWFYGAAAQDGSDWLVDAAPSLSKTTDLTDTPPSANNNIDCQPDSFMPIGQTSAQTVCTFESPLGTLTSDGHIDTGADTFASLQASDYHSFFIPTVDASYAIVSLTSPGIGNYVGIYRHLTKASLRKNFSASGVYYDIAEQPDSIIHDPATGNQLEIDVASIAFSANGVWMVANTPHRGLVRVNLSDLSVQLFAAPIEPSWFLGLATPSLAISDDGRYVAGNTDLFGTGNLNVYDLSTCTDQSAAQQAQAHYCAGKDIWHGLKADGTPMGDGLLSRQADLQRPTHIRFVNDDNIRFSAEYAVTSATDYKAAVYVATAAGGVQHKLGLLGLGDSYISGQGAFQYRYGTDTTNDTCHLSELSYPFILGQQSFNSFNSIACSGAQTKDLETSDDNYKGQVTDGIKWKDRTNKSQIITDFNPGYVGQTTFASTYLPQAMLLSVGGDDVGFADIVKSCVAHDDTCYNTYEDRAELVNEIDSTYSKLVNTYTTLREQSGGGRLYVVGYPQIAMPGGNCGLNVHLNDTEVQFSVELIDYLDSVVQRAANTAGVTYVDVQHAFDGHRLCESGDKAVNGLTAGGDGGVTVLGKTINVIGSESYHPTVLGYQLLAAAIAAQTDNLQSPMPTASTFNKPSLGTNIALLNGVAKTGRPLNNVTYDTDMTNGVLVSGNQQDLQVSGSSAQLQPGAQYQIILHSTPTTLAEGTLDANGDINATLQLPVTITPGFHTVHVYTTNMAGQPVDIQKIVYVAASIAAVTNTQNGCLVVPLSGQDIDGDGVDDACDPDIGKSVAKVTLSGDVSATASLNSPSAPVSKSESAQMPARQQLPGGANVATLGTTTGEVPQLAGDYHPRRAAAYKPVFRLSWDIAGVASVAVISSIYFIDKLLRH